MVDYIKRWGINFTGWLVVSTAIGIGLETGKGIYQSCKERLSKNLKRAESK